MRVTQGEVEVYEESVGWASTGITGTPRAPRDFSGGKIRILANTAGNAGFHGGMYGAYCVQGALSRAEIESIGRNFYSGFAAPGSVLLPIAATNVSANVDSLALTTYTATVTLDKSVEATADSLSITTNTASVALDKSVTSTTDSLVVITQTADVNLDKNVSAGS